MPVAVWKLSANFSAKASRVRLPEAYVRTNAWMALRLHEIVERHQKGLPIFSPGEAHRSNGERSGVQTVGALWGTGERGGGRDRFVSRVGEPMVIRRQRLEAGMRIQVPRSELTVHLLFRELLIRDTTNRRYADRLLSSQEYANQAMNLKSTPPAIWGR
jgi:hypothetical protein